MIGNAINLNGLLLAVPLVGAVLLAAWWLPRRKKRTAKQKPGHLLRYCVKDKTAAACRGLLGKQSAEDMFAYKLESAPAGGWFMTLLCHNPTGQKLETVFLLQFEDDNPAMLEVRFVREAFGMREPVVGEGLLDAFFAAKLGAQRLQTQDLI